MKASEAMLLGSTMIPPRRAVMGGTPGAPGCVMAMICEAIGLQRNGTILIKQFPFLTAYTQLPCRCPGLETVASCVIHLFDDHVQFEPGEKPNEEWTIEQIAQWLSHVEDEMSADATEPNSKPTKKEIPETVNQPSKEPVGGLV